jgi:hypothetical protein
VSVLFSIVGLEGYILTCSFALCLFYQGARGMLKFGKRRSAGAGYDDDDSDDEY